MSVVPINIRPHLVPYFFKEFDGHSAMYLNQKVTAVKISASSSLGKWMRLFMVRVDLPEKPSDYYNIYLTVEDTPDGKKKYDGNFYRYESGAKSFLMLPKDVNTALNELLEDIFRTNFVNFVDGYINARTDKKVNDNGTVDAINIFIEKYELLEVGFSTESLRAVYYREKERGRLERFRHRPGNRISGK